MPVALTWGSYLETDLSLGEFFPVEFTLSLYVMPQFPYSVSGPILLSGPTPGAAAGWFRLAQGNFGQNVLASCAGGGPHVLGGPECLVSVERQDHGAQQGWRLCLNCHGLFFAGNDLGNTCPASPGSSHTAWEAGQYRVLHNPSSVDLLTAGKVQQGWRWCRRCQGLVAPGTSGVCAAGGVHDCNGSGRYALRLRPANELGLHAHWFMCVRCGVLTYGGVGTSVDLAVGGTRANFPALLRRGQWHHLALVRMRGQLWMFVDGQQAGLPVAVPSTPVPSAAMMRLGRTDPSRATGMDQFYGLVDDLALFDGALDGEAIANLARRVDPLNGNESGLVAGWPMSPSSHDVKLSRSVLLHGGAKIKGGQGKRDALDPLLLTTPTPAVPLRLPFRAGEVWVCGQSNDTPTGSHKGGGGFSFDFDRVGAQTEGAPFIAPATGVLADLTWSGQAGGDRGNEIALQTARDELVGFGHYRQPEGRIGGMAIAGQQLALTSRTGAGSAHLHTGSVNPAGWVFASAYTDYEVSKDEGKSWSRVTLGVPGHLEWVRNPVSPTFERGWRWCRRCGVLHLASAASPGVCPVGGSPHDSTGSGSYLLIRNGAGEPGWTRCRRCGALVSLAGVFIKCAAGGSHEAGGDQYTLVAGGIGHQPGWRECLRCRALVHGMAPNRCPAGGVHDEIFPRVSYTVLEDTGPAPFGQSDWRRCEKCLGLYFAPDGHSGVCPGGGQHATEKLLLVNYHLLHTLSPTFGQPDWRWCRNCEGLFHGGTSRGICPVGGEHDAPTGTGNYRILGIGARPGERDWRQCRRCRGLFQGPGPTGRCPGGGAHDPTSSQSYQLEPQRLLH